MYYDGCADRLEKGEIQTTNVPRTHEGRNGTLGHRESEQLGDDATYNQPHGLREKIYSGRLKIKHTDEHALPVKSVKIVKGREQQRVAEGKLWREKSKAHPRHHTFNGMAGGQVRGGTSRCSGKKDKSTIASSQKLECL